MLLYFIDQLEEEGSKFAELLKNNQFVTQEADQYIAENIEARNQVLTREEKKRWQSSFVNLVHNAAQPISPTTYYIFCFTSSA
jgi:hypothetical protein